MMKLLNRLLFLFLCLSLLACGKKNNKEVLDTPTSGKIKIAVDESFRPIIEAELMVFQSIYGNAKIEAQYLPENKLFEQLNNDSVCLIISSRVLTETEKQQYRNKQLIAKEVAIAKDAIAVLVNNDNPDSILCVNQIQQILTGKVTSWRQINQKSGLGDIEVVFDNRNSSVVHFAIDSICKGMKISPAYLSSMKINTDVIDYVSKHKGSIGFIGAAWVSDRDDSTQVSFMKKVRVTSLSLDPDAAEDNSYQPYAAYVYQDLYPFTRMMYAINIDPRNGLPSGFVSFLASDKGQRIILKFGIVPAVAPTRLVETRDNY